MLSDPELEDITRRLDAFDEQHNDHQHQLNALLRKYRSLLKDYQEVKPHSIHNNHTATNGRVGSGRSNSLGRLYALMLVDGDSYEFLPDVLGEEEEGGRRAAHLLRQQINQSLFNKGISGCNVRVRIYADFVSLSKRLSLSKRIKPHKRSIAPFAAGFTSYDPLFDFVDSGEAADSTYSKLAATFQIHAEDLNNSSRCRHIFFAGCHDVRHVSMLIPWRSSRDQVSLVSNKRPPSEYDDLDLPLQRFESVLTQALGGAGALARSATPQMQASVRPTTTKQDQWQVPDFAPGATGHGIANGRLSRSSEQSSRRYQSDNTGMAIVPPHKEDMVSVNREGQRIDVHLPVPAESVMQVYAHMDPRPCNAFHLYGTCGKPDCPFGHTPINRSIFDAIRVKVRETPCRSGHGCRVRNCMYGHVCNKQGCFGPKPGKCKFRPTMHQMDKQVDDWIEPFEPPRSTHHIKNGNGRDTNALSSLYDGLHGRAASSSDWRSSSNSPGVLLSYQEDPDHQMMADPHLGHPEKQQDRYQSTDARSGSDTGNTSYSDKPAATPYDTLGQW